MRLTARWWGPTREGVHEVETGAPLLSNGGHRSCRPTRRDTDQIWGRGCDRAVAYPEVIGCTAISCPVRCRQEVVPRCPPCGGTRLAHPTSQDADIKRGVVPGPPPRFRKDQAPTQPAWCIPTGYDRGAAPPCRSDYSSPARVAAGCSRSAR